MNFSKWQAQWCVKALALCGVAAATTFVASAQESATDGGERQMDAQALLIQSLNPTTAKERYIASLLAPLRRLDLNQNGLDAEDFEQAGVRERTGIRARAAQEFLRYDYDGDLTVTRAEIIAYTSRGSGFGEREADQLLAPFDTDGNGVATIQEAMAAAVAKGRDRYQTDKGAWLALDPDGDARLTAAELTELGERTFARFDADGDGVISNDESIELSALQSAMAEGKRLRNEQCVFPPASALAEVVAVSAYSGDAVSTTYVEHPSIATGVIDVVIEPGDTPLYLVLSSFRSVIWRLTGATKRVEHVLASSERSKGRDDAYDATRGLPRSEQRMATSEADRHPTSAAGMTGLAADKLSVVGKHCLRATYGSRPGDRKTIDRIARIISGRPAAQLSASYSMSQVTLPSGGIVDLFEEREPVAAGFDPVKWAEAAKSAPGGIVAIAPESVRAAEPVGSYAVLPAQFGIAQLIATGALLPDADGRLRIVRQIPQWPAELTGGNMEIFILPDDVAPPEGKPGDGCVLSEEQAAKAAWRQYCTARPANIQTQASSP